MSFRIAVDTGGTFSDVVLADDAGHFSLSKAPTTPGKIFDGISQALEFAAAERALGLHELLAQTDVLIYATTRSTNAIITGTTARTALITTEGFPDTLVFREGGKLRPFDFRQPYPEPYIPKRLTFEMPERISSEGHVVRELTEADAVAVLREVAAAGVEAIAVSLLLVDRQPGARGADRLADRARAAGRAVHALGATEPDHPRIPAYVSAAIDALAQAAHAGRPE